MAIDAKETLEREVYVGGAYKPFGELTADDAKALAAELRGISAGGLAAKVMPVRMGWTELATLLGEPGATVSDLDDDTVLKFAQRVWVNPPGGTLLP